MISSDEEHEDYSDYWLVFNELINEIKRIRSEEGLLAQHARDRIFSETGVKNEKEYFSVMGVTNFPNKTEYR